MATKITLTYTLDDTNLNIIADGLGYSETSTEIDQTTNEWKSVPNTESRTEYIVRNFTQSIQL